MRMNQACFQRILHLQTTRNASRKQELHAQVEEKGLSS
jgi:hypothetical protein